MPGERDKEQCQVHAGKEDHARPGWTTSIRGQDSPWKSRSEWQRTEINGESTSMVWPTLGSRTAKEQNSWYTQNPSTCHSQDYFDALLSYLHGLIDRVSCINLGINWDQESTVFFSNVSSSSTTVFGWPNKAISRRQLDPLRGNSSPSGRL